MLGAARDGFAARGDETADEKQIVGMLDSLVHVTYFRDRHFREWKDDGFTRYPPGFIPQFDDETYAERIAYLNSKTALNLTYNSHVGGFIRLYGVDKRRLTSKILGLTSVYFPLFEEKLRQYRIPQELKYLAIVESALNPTAVSSANAKGLWQFIYGTGKMYGLESSAFVEDRFDPEKATIAACRHMRDLYNIYGDWFLVLAAYNSGAGNVNKAIRRAGGARSYWTIWPYLPRETRGYVPAFIAVTYIMNYYREHNIRPWQPGDLYLDIATVNVSEALTFDQISRGIGVSVDDLEFLNPQYKLNVIPADSRANSAVRLPRRYVSRFRESERKLYASKSDDDRATLLAKAREVQPSSTPAASGENIHVVSKGETLASIARMYRCYVSQIVQWNNLRDSRIYPGQKLRVFGSPGASSSGISSGTRQVVYHKVRRGENLGLIAETYGVGVSRIVSWNGLGRKRTIYPGQKLKIFAAQSSRGSGGPSAKYHKVNRGESLGLIARKYGVSVAQLASWNNLGGKRVIHPGQRLKLFAATRVHKVRRGENLIQIAKKYGVSVSDLASWNKLGRKRTIYPGQKLRVLSE
ncbi:lytic transglycosylase [Prosthecochloris sp. GSB1]|nr:lytic transglycosylase [Prosthecochloris sp. GSB1]